METNIDEALLISARIDVNSQIPIISQILRIAVYDEFKAYETYTKILQPFVNIKEAEAVHYAALIKLMEKYGVEVPINDWASKIEIPNTLIECCELGVAGEISNIAMYNNLLGFTIENDVKDTLYRLQAASFNNHLPAFRNSVLSHYNSGSITNINPENIMEKLGEYQVILDDIMSGNIDESSISNIFSKLNLSMVSGAVLGAATIAILNNYLSKKNITEEEE